MRVRGIVLETKRLATALNLKAVDPSGRTLEGYAAVFGNLDRTGDIIDRKAFDRTLRDNPDVQVFIGHRADTLPVGEAFDVSADGTGLFTRVKIYDTPDGDALLEVARQRLARGKSLGMSIGYRTVRDRFDPKTKARHLLDVDLVEFSYLASPALAANPRAMVTAMKSRNGASFEQIQDSLRAAVREQFGEQAELVSTFDEHLVVKSDRRTLEVPYEAGGDGEWSLGDPQPAQRRKAALDAAERDRIKPGDFAFTDSDGDGHLPIANEAHVRAALGRFNQTHFPDAATKKSAARKILAAAKRLGIDVDDSSAVAEAAKSWEDDSVAHKIRALSAHLADLSDEILEDQRAMYRLDHQVKAGAKLKSSTQSELEVAIKDLQAIVEWARQVEAGEDGKAYVDWLRHAMALQELMEVA